MTALDIITLLLSIISLVISVSVAILEIYFNKKNTAVSLEAEICIKIYYDYLVKEIPEGRDYISYSDGKLAEIGKLQKTLNDIRRDSIFFKYRDKKFYDNLKDKLRSLEDYLVQSEGEMEQEDFGNFCKKINEDIAEIYHMIMKEISGVSKR